MSLYYCKTSNDLFSLNFGVYNSMVHFVLDDNEYKFIIFQHESVY